MTKRHDPTIDQGLAEPQASGQPELSFLDHARDDHLSSFWLLWNGDNRWRVNNSTIGDYSRRALIDGRVSGLTDIILDRLGVSEANVGLDVAAGSSAQALRDLLDSGVLDKALATNYQDRRPRKIRRDPRLDHIKGDLTRQSTWERIVGWQAEFAPEGFDLVMHRPVGGLQDLDPRTYQGAAHALMDMTRPGGMLFTQVPRRMINLSGLLQELCDDLHERPDFEGMLTSGPHPKHAPPNESHRYVVIFKRQPVQP